MQARQAVLTKNTRSKAGSGGPKLDKVRVIVLCGLAAFVGLSALVMYRLTQVPAAARDWKPGEVVVGSERVAQRISGLPTHEASDLSAADLSALWLAAFEAVQTGACGTVVGGGVQSPTSAVAPGIYYVSCGGADALQKWYREDGHGVVACADANACAAS